MAYIGGKVDDNMATKIIIKMPLLASKLKTTKKINFLIIFIFKERK